MIAEVSKQAFDALIASSSGDADALTALEAQLRALSLPWAGPLRLRVIDLRRKLIANLGSGQLNNPGGTLPATTYPRTAASSWGTPFGLPAPDGRPLYQYRLASASFAALEAYLRVQARPQGFARAHDEALFVLWAAEWFRRCFKGGLRKWNDVGDSLGLNLTQAEWRSSADRGFRIWRLAPLRLNGVTHRLLNLARQGGFPIAAIDEDGAAWAANYLERLVGILLAEADPSADTAYLHAGALESMVPESWHSTNFFAVSADLALAVLTLRREAEAGGALVGLPPSVWLDLNRKDWRDALPLVVDGEAGRHLIDGMMKAMIVRGGSGAVRASRLIEKVNGTWQPKIQFELNGRLKGVNLAAFDTSWSRLRMFAGAALARYVPGELAVVEPGEEGEWIALASSMTQRAIDAPLDVPIEVELRGGGQRIGLPIVLANGAAVTSPLLVCHPEGGGNEVNPKRLIIAGVASGKYRADPLYVFAPAEWELSAGGDAETTELIEETHNSGRLWRVQGGAIVTSHQGDHYRLVAGQALEDRDTLVLSGNILPYCRSATGLIPILRGKPTLFVREHGRERTPRSHEVWWRHLGNRDWQLFKTFDAVGHCEFAWRDADTRMLRDRQSAIIVPDGFKITVKGAGEHVELCIEGWTGRAAVPKAIRCDAYRWSIHSRGSGETTVTLRLISPSSLPVDLDIPLPHRASIAEWTGRSLTPRTRFALADMHRLVARAEGRCQLMAQLRDRNGVRISEAEIRWSFEQELPLNSIRDDIAALLRPLGDLDASVELNFSDAHEEYWNACEFDIALKVEPYGLVPTRAVVDEAARIVGRALHEPQLEIDFGAHGLINQPTHRPVDIPNLHGAWLIYLRAHERVLSRPFVLCAPPLDKVPEDLLGGAMAIAERHARSAALLELCIEAETAGPQSSAIIRAIINLATGLAGLPPSTFDILHLVGKRPLLAARLLFESSDQELGAVAALTAGLPFAWPLIPRRVWEEAARLRFDSIIAALPDTFPNPVQLAAATISHTRALIASIEPATGALLDQQVAAMPIAEIAQAFMQQAHDSADTFALSPFRAHFSDRLPKWPFSQEYWRALDAPCTAALAAREEITLTAPQLRCVKDVARRHPRYFEQAFIAVFKEHSFA